MIIGLIFSPGFPITQYQLTLIYWRCLSLQNLFIGVSPRCFNRWIELLGFQITFGKIHHVVRHRRKSLSKSLKILYSYYHCAHPHFACFKFIRFLTEKTTFLGAIISGKFDRTGRRYRKSVQNSRIISFTNYPYLYQIAVCIVMQMVGENIV